MKEKNDEKIIICLKAILLVLVLGVTGFFVYNNVISKDDNDSQKVSYKMIKSDKIGSTISRAEKYIKFIEDENGDLYLTYPELIGESEDIMNINNSIKKNIEKNIEDLNDVKGLPGACYWAKMVESDRIIGYEHFPYLSYDVVESDKYLSIIETMISYTECATGYSNIQEIYVLDKTSGNLVKKEDVITDEVLESFRNDMVNSTSDINAEFKDFFDELIENDDYYFFYSESGNIVITYFGIYNDTMYENIDGSWELY